MAQHSLALPNGAPGNPATTAPNSHTVARNQHATSWEEATPQHKPAHLHRPVDDAANLLHSAPAEPAATNRGGAVLAEHKHGPAINAAAASHDALACTSLAVCKRPTDGLKTDPQHSLWCERDKPLPTTVAAKAEAHHYINVSNGRKRPPHACGHRQKPAPAQ